MTTWRGSTRVPMGPRQLRQQNGRARISERRSYSRFEGELVHGDTALHAKVPSGSIPDRLTKPTRLPGRGNRRTNVQIRDAHPKRKRGVPVKQVFNGAVLLSSSRRTDRPVASRPS